MTSVSGHLMELDFEDQYRKWHSCQPVQLYDLPVYKKVPQVSALLIWQHVLINMCTLVAFSQSMNR
jgi:uncharacterized membrane protein